MIRLIVFLLALYGYASAVLPTMKFYTPSAKDSILRADMDTTFVAIVNDSGSETYNAFVWKDKKGNYYIAAACSQNVYFDTLRAGTMIVDTNAVSVIDAAKLGGILADRYVLKTVGTVISGRDTFTVLQRFTGGIKSTGKDTFALIDVDSIKGALVVTGTERHTGDNTFTGTSNLFNNTSTFGAALTGARLEVSSSAVTGYGTGSAIAKLTIKANDGGALAGDTVLVGSPHTAAESHGDSYLRLYTDGIRLHSFKHDINVRAETSLVSIQADEKIALTAVDNISMKADTTKVDSGLFDVEGKSLFEGGIYSTGHDTSHDITADTVRAVVKGSLVGATTTDSFTVGNVLRLNNSSSTYRAIIFNTATAYPQITGGSSDVRITTDDTTKFRIITGATSVADFGTDSIVFRENTYIAKAYIDTLKKKTYAQAMKIDSLKRLTHADTLHVTALDYDPPKLVFGFEDSLNFGLRFPSGSYAETLMVRDTLRGSMFRTTEALQCTLKNDTLITGTNGCYDLFMNVSIEGASASGDSFKTTVIRSRGGVRSQVGYRATIYRKSADSRTTPIYRYIPNAQAGDRYWLAIMSLRAGVYHVYSCNAKLEYSHKE